MEEETPLTQNTNKKMDSVKIFKGYGKVEDKQDHLEDQQHHHRKTSKSLIATVSIFAILSLTVALAFALAALVHHTDNEPSEQQQQTLNSPECIRVVCNVTHFPHSCFAAVSSSAQNPTDPEAILSLSLRASIDELTRLASSLGAKPSNSKGSPLADCKDQIDDALSRLNDSLSAMAAVPGSGGVTLTDRKISDIQTWVSAAMTDQQTCVDGLEEAGSVAAVAEVKSMMKRSSEYVSNSLAIVANIRTLLQQLHMPLH